jgi:hypothetical protein
MVRAGGTAPLDTAKRQLIRVIRKLIGNLALPGETRATKQNALIYGKNQLAGDQADL